MIGFLLLLRVHLYVDDGKAQQCSWPWARMPNELRRSSSHGWDSEMAISSGKESVLVQWAHHHGTTEFHIPVHLGRYHRYNGFIFCLRVSFLLP